MCCVPFSCSPHYVVNHLMTPPILLATFGASRLASEIHEGETAPKKYKFAPDITRRGAANAPITFSNNYDNLLAFVFCFVCLI